MWVGAGVTQPLCSPLNLAASSSTRLHNAADFMIDSMLLFSNNIETRVSDVFPLVPYYYLNIRYSTPLDYLSFET